MSTCTPLNTAPVLATQAQPQPQVKPKPKPKAKISTYVSSADLERLCTKTLNPNFRPPRRLRIPTPPSLRASLLPPPCAELDERPRWRVRRFVLWRDRVPAMRQAVLDPRKRAHLKRFQAFATPSAPAFMRGDRSVSGHLTPPARARGEDNKDGPSVPITPYPTPPPTPLPHFRSPRPPTTLAAPPPASTPVPPVLRRKPKSTHQTRKALRARAMQHRLILERQEERRWRLAMKVLMDDMLLFVQHNTTPHVGGKKRKPTWIHPPPTEQIKRYIQFMKDVRASSKNVWKHLDMLAPDPVRLPLPLPVQGVAAAKAKVRQMQDREEKKRQKRREREIKTAKNHAEQARVREQAAHRVAPAPAPPPPVVARAYTVHPRERPPTPFPRLRSGPAASSSDSSSSSPSAAPSPGAAVTPPSPPSSSSSSSQSDRDRLVTPPGSDRIQPASFRVSPKAQPNSVIPDDIARQLAEMLQAFHRLGAGATAGAGEYRGGKQQSIEEEEASIEVVSAARSRRPSPKSSSAGGSDTSTVLPSGHRDEGEEAQSDDADEVMTFATGELNIDDDTAALWSGGGESHTDTLT